MKSTKYSRQRESILHYLHNTKEHPTADTIYLHVQKILPSISLGTVYRNLSQLEKHGEIQKLSSISGNDRYDGNPNPHYHFICNDCNSVFDLNMPSLDHINTLAASAFSGIIEGHVVDFYGKCENCFKFCNTKI